MGDDDSIELLGIEAGPVRVDEGARPRVDVDVGLAVDEADARGSELLGYHGEAAAACPEEMDVEGYQCEYCRRGIAGFKTCPD